MCRAKKGFAVLIAVFLITGFFLVSNPIGASPGSEHGKFGTDPFYALMHILNLTDVQKAEVAAILRSNEANAKTVATGLAHAIAQVRNDIIRGSYNTDHFNALVNYERQSLQLRAKNIAAILPILTKTQQTTLQDIQDKADSDINALIDARFARLGEWIAKHSKRKCDR